MYRSLFTTSMPLLLRRMTTMDFFSYIYTDVQLAHFLKANTPITIWKSEYIYLLSKYPSNRKIFTDPSKTMAGLGYRIATFDSILLRCSVPSYFSIFSA